MSKCKLLPSKHLCVVSGGRFIYVSGHNLDVVQEPRMVVTISSQLANQRRGRRGRSMVPRNSGCPENRHCSVREVCVRVRGRPPVWTFFLLLPCH